MKLFLYFEVIKNSYIKHLSLLTCLKTALMKIAIKIMVIIPLKCYCNLCFCNIAK